MTPEKRADKIMCIDGIVFDTAAKNDSVEIHRLIAAEIRAAVEEAVKSSYPNQAIGYVIEMAKAKTYEDAAKLTESLFPTLQNETPNICTVIAQAIRNKAQEVLKITG